MKICLVKHTLRQSYYALPCALFSTSTLNPPPKKNNNRPAETIAYKGPLTACTKLWKKSSFEMYTFFFPALQVYLHSLCSFSIRKQIYDLNLQLQSIFASTPPHPLPPHPTSERTSSNTSRSVSPILDSVGTSCVVPIHPPLPLVDVTHDASMVYLVYVCLCLKTIMEKNHEHVW